MQYNWNWKYAMELKIMILNTCRSYFILIVSNYYIGIEKDFLIQ